MTSPTAALNGPEPADSLRVKTVLVLETPNPRAEAWRRWPPGGWRAEVESQFDTVYCRDYKAWMDELFNLITNYEYGSRESFATRDRTTIRSNCRTSATSKRPWRSWN